MDIYWCSASLDRDRWIPSPPFSLLRKFVFSGRDIASLIQLRLLQSQFILLCFNTATVHQHIV